MTWNLSRMGALVLACALGPVGLTHAAEETPETKTDMSKGGVGWSWGDNSIRLVGFVQLRFIAEDTEEFDLDPVGSTGYGEPDGLITAFQIPRARLGFKGTMWKPWLKYALVYELSQTSGDRDAKLKDAYVEFAAKPLASIRFGQFKVPFGFQELVPDEAQLFAERAITNAFAPARDQGATILGLTSKKHFGYAAGVFNGSGESKNQDDTGLMYAGWVYWDPLGEYKLSEGSPDAPQQGSVVRFAAGYRTGEPGRGYDTAGVFEDPNNQDAFNVAFAWKNRRFTATAEYYQQTTETKNPPPATADVDAGGWHVQGSVAAIPQKLDFGLRYAVVDSNTNAPDGAVTEIRGVGSYFWKGHNLKLLLDLGTLEYEPNAPGRTTSGATTTKGTRLVSGDVTDTVARLQVQLAF